MLFQKALKSSILQLVAVVVTMTFATQASAVTWTGSVSSDMTNSSNWTGAPNTSQDAVVSGSASYTLSLADGGTFYYRNFRMQGTGTTMINMTGGTFASGTSAGAQNYVALSRENTGGVTIFNISGGTATCNSTTYIAGGGANGNYGSGTAYLNVSGGSYTAANMIVGAIGTGTLNITGGTVTLNSTLQLGAQFSGKTGSGTVYLNGGTLTVGSTNITGVTSNGGSADFEFLSGSLVLAGNESAYNTAALLQGYVGSWFHVGPGSLAVFYSSSANTTTFTLSPVPEPNTITILAVGLVGLLAYAWRKRK